MFRSAFLLIGISTGAAVAALAALPAVAAVTSVEAANSVRAGVAAPEMVAFRGGPHGGAQFFIPHGFHGGMNRGPGAGAMHAPGGPFARGPGMGPRMAGSDFRFEHRQRRFGFDAGLGAGLLVGGLGYPYYAGDYGPSDTYYDQDYGPAADEDMTVAPPASGSVAYCMSRFNSYRPETGTYLGYDGFHHPCP